MKLTATDVDAIFAYDAETKKLKAAYGSSTLFAVLEVPVRARQGFAARLARPATRLEYKIKAHTYRGEDLSYALTYGMWPASQLVPRDDDWHNLDPENWTVWYPQMTASERGIYSKGPANYRVQVYDGKRAVYVGTFATLAEARQARDRAESLAAPNRTRMTRTSLAATRPGPLPPLQQERLDKYLTALRAKRQELAQLSQMLIGMEEQLLQEGEVPPMPHAAELALASCPDLAQALAEYRPSHGYRPKLGPEPEKQAI